MSSRIRGRSRRSSNSARSTQRRTHPAPVEPISSTMTTVTNPVWPASTRSHLAPVWTMLPNALPRASLTRSPMKPFSVFPRPANMIEQNRDALAVAQVLNVISRLQLPLGPPPAPLGCNAPTAGSRGPVASESSYRAGGKGSPARTPAAASPLVWISTLLSVKHPPHQFHNGGSQQLAAVEGWNIGADHRRQIRAMRPRRQLYLRRVRAVRIRPCRGC